MWSLATFALAFCFCVSSQIIDDIDEWVWIKARYEDLKETNLKFLEIRERSRLGVVGSSDFNIFERGDEDDKSVYVGFSYNFDEVTHDIESHLVKWDLESTSFEDVGAQPRRTDNGFQEAWTGIYYFNTLDGETWAFHAFVHADNITEKIPDPITLRGDSLLYQFDESADQFNPEPVYRVYSQEATLRTEYFTTPDNREFLWTANFAAPLSRTGTPNCTVHEYKAGTGWSQVNTLGYNCSKFPRDPLVFTNNLEEWLYLDVAYATPSWKSDGSEGTLSSVGVGQKWYTYRNSGLVDADVIDNLALSNVNYIEHFQSNDWDYLVALSTDGVLSTYRLFWQTHRVQELTAVRLARAAPTHMEMFTFVDHTCLSLSYGAYPGLTESTPSVQDNYFAIYCWDPAHDRWNYVIHIPSFGVIKTKTFVDDDRLFLVALQNEGHLQHHTFTTYEITEWHDDQTLITREAEPDSVEMYKMLMDIHHELDDIHHYKAIVIAIIVLLVTIVILQLLQLVKGMSGGGGGGGDYQSFS